MKCFSKIKRYAPIHQPSFKLTNMPSKKQQSKLLAAKAADNQAKSAADKQAKSAAKAAKAAAKAADKQAKSAAKAADKQAKDEAKAAKAAAKAADKQAKDEAKAAKAADKAAKSAAKVTILTDIKTSHHNTLDMSSDRQELFDRIAKVVSESVDQKFIESTKTKKGNTQVSERYVIEKIRTILTNMKLAYTEAGSQQSKDFRNVGGIGLNIEVKKTDSAAVYFNDTCPTKDIWYIIIFTGKKNKKTADYSILPQLLYINGFEFVKDSPWIDEYIRAITALKDMYARGASKKQLAGIMEVYPRPTFKAKIDGFLK